MRILLIEPDVGTVSAAELALRAAGFNVYATDLGEEGVDLAKIYDYDAIISETVLPDMSGLEVLRQLRAGAVSTPFMFVTGDADVGTKVKAFAMGADDYAVKPTHKDELAGRLHALIRRAKGHAQSIITTGNLSVNLTDHSTTVAGRRINLTGKEQGMMELLALRKGTTLTKEHFLNHLYGGIDEPELKIIDVFICKLRTKLRHAGVDGHIHTVWGRGYVLRDEVQVRDKGEAPRDWPTSRIARAIIPLATAAAPMPTAEVAEILKVLPNPVLHDLTAAEIQGFVKRWGRGRSQAWSLTDAGRQKLTDHGLIPTTAEAA